MKKIPNSNKLEHADTYTFKYNSDDDSIDLNTLLLSQINFATVLNEIKSEVAPGVDLSIRIKPLTKGSVPFDIILNVSWLSSLLTSDNATYASEIVGTMVGLIQLRLWLKGKKPTTIEVNGDTVNIIVGEAKFIVKRRVYEIAEKNRVIDLALQKGFAAVESDESVTGIEILDVVKKPLIQIPREEFESFDTENQFFIDEKNQKTATSKERLTIFKVVFEKGIKWQFYQGSRKISASIITQGFWDKINNGESFAKGDALVVELETTTVFDNTMGIYVEKGFAVTNVIEHIPKPKDNQTQLFQKGD